MSILKTIYLQHLNGSSPNATLDANGNMTVTGTVVSSSPTGGMRNKIINGDMRIDQRNNGSAVTTTGSFPVDRWNISVSNDGAFSAQQDSTAPAGFTNSLKFTVTTADTSLAATQYAVIRQKVEGHNIADLDFGKSTAKTITLSFWVRSSLTGTFGGSLTNDSQNRSYPYTYTINAANTWEFKSITIPGDITGTWLTTNGAGFDIFWSLGMGSTYSGTAGAWTATQYIYSVTGATSLVGTNGATFYLTGVQLEAGTIATPFERRLYGTELALCQRYHYRTRQYVNTAQMWIAPGAIISTTQARYNVTLPSAMRTFPAISVTPAYNTGSGWQINVTGINNYSWSGAPTILDYDNSTGTIAICFLATTGSTMTSSYIGLGSVPYMPTGVNTNQLILDAEL